MRVGRSPSQFNRKNFIGKIMITWRESSPKFRGSIPIARSQRLSVLSPQRRGTVFMRSSIAQLIVAMAGGSWVLTTATVAIAETAAPRWEVGSICQGDKSVEACSHREASSRNSVLNRWLATPDADRQFCLRDLHNRRDETYWSLLDCLGTRAIANMTE